MSYQLVAEISTWQHTQHPRQTSMPQVGFEPTISAGERPQTYALNRAGPMGPAFINSSGININHWRLWRTLNVCVKLYGILKLILNPITTFLSSLVCVIMCLNCLYNRYIYIYIYIYIWEFTYKIIISIHSALWYKFTYTIRGLI
jgi:hypothetical protein